MMGITGYERSASSRGEKCHESMHRPRMSVEQAKVLPGPDHAAAKVVTADIWERTLKVTAPFRISTAPAVRRTRS
jgi:hypothetical protein